jgi:glycerol-3-phosphate dehydrogenase
MAETTSFDLLVVGGGINGCGIARDAAGRGLSVLLVEQGDLGSATSSASSKLIHGGLRYLEHYELRLVREALAEREVLLANAPHIAWPLTFVLPHVPSMRPAWMIRAGLFLYDHLARRDWLPGSAGIDLTTHPAGAALKTEYTRGFTYADGWVDDSRLVVLNAVDALERGATIRTRTRLVSARRENGLWTASLEPASGGRADTVTARILVNAAGPWVDEVRSAKLGQNAPARIRLVKGSHIVVARLYEGPHAYILQQPDRRVVFLLPFADDFTLIGTTDVPHEGPPGTAAISDAEIAYLCAAASRFLRSPVSPAQIVWSYAGLRPLLDDESAAPSAITRDYTLELDAPQNAPPLLSVVGGKITTYRRLAESALAKLTTWTGRSRAWTATAPLPGGDMPRGDIDAFRADGQRKRPWLPAPLLRRLARAYGTRIDAVLGDAASLADLGRDLGSGLTEREVAYLRSTEFARTAEDILWRRTKLGLRADAATIERVESALHRS